MKALNECKEYFKDVLKDYYQYAADDRTGFYVFKADTLSETLTFIYGDDFKRVKPFWIQEALNEFYKA